MPLPTVSLKNELKESVTVYDSFSDQDDANYFGVLTPIAMVPADTTASVKLIHPTSVLIVGKATTNSPLARFCYLPGVLTGPYSVGKADAEAMAHTMDFIKFITANKNDPLTVAFQSLWTDTSKSQVTSVNQFFSQHETYAKCTFATYMMGITSEAEQPHSKGKPMNQATYSLSTLATLLGGTWPSFLPDIVVTQFTCNTQNDVLSLQAGIDLKKLPAPSDAALKFFGSLFSVQQLQFAASFNYGFNAGVTGTRLSVSLDAMHVPFGNSGALTINKPTATIDANPLFQFIDFTVLGAIPFNIFGEEFEADVSMNIDNIEASFGVVVKADQTSLPTPPAMQGVHFDTFGVGIGVIFEPPSAAIGLSGQLHIGDAANGTLVALDDDTFVVVCQLIEEVPNPLYISFYVPQMHLTDIFTVFTNVACPMDVPVSFTDLSFKWSENPMEPVALPDGSLSSMGYGFSAAANILGLSFYGDVSIDLTNGVEGDIEMCPLTLGSIFSITGDGTGVFIKVDANGNPIKNNQLVTSTAIKQVIDNATLKQLVPAGGAVLKIQTLASPFLHLNGAVTLFEATGVQMDADITSGGISFDVAFDGLLSSNMSCTLSDWQTLSATFQYGINQTFSLGSVLGIPLGSITLDATVSAHFGISASSSNIVMTIGGSFDFESLNLTFGDFTADVDIQCVSDLLSAIVNYIEQNAQEIFGDIVGTALTWATNVQQNLIIGVNDVANVLQTAFQQDADQVASTMNEAGFDAQQVVQGLQSAFNLGETAVAQTMQQAGYAANEVASALQDVFGNDAAAIASAMQDAFNMSVSDINDLLGDIGFSDDEISDAFQSLGGDFADWWNSIHWPWDNLAVAQSSVKA